MDIAGGSLYYSRSGNQAEFIQTAWRVAHDGDPGNVVIHLSTSFLLFTFLYRTVASKYLNVLSFILRKDYFSLQQSLTLYFVHSQLQFY